MKKSKPSTRELLLEAATKLFLEKGYADTSLQQIAESVGLKQGNVYYHFKTKRSLAIGVLEQWSKCVTEGLSALERHATPKDRVVAYLTWTREQRTIYFNHGCPIASLTDELIREDAESVASISIPYAAIVEWLERQFAESGSGKRDARERARFVLSVAQGAIHVGHVLRDESVYTGMKRLIGDWLE